MKKIILFLMVLVFAFLLLNSAQAQSDDEEDYTVVLPDAAQVCVLPAAPDAIPEEATYDELVAAKGGVATFQGALEEYRTCLKAAEDGDEELTAGNKQALIASYNYSVDMEERVAQRFNEAVRSYKERNPSQ